MSGDGLWTPTHECGCIITEGHVCLPSWATHGHGDDNTNSNSVESEAPIHGGPRGPALATPNTPGDLTTGLSGDAMVSHDSMPAPPYRNRPKGWRR